MNLIRDIARRAYWRIRRAFPINRVVVILTPAAAGLAGSIASWIAEHFPGVELDEASLTAIFLAGAGAAVAAIYKWLDGWMQYERYLMELYLPEARRQRRKAGRGR